MDLLRSFDRTDLFLAVFFESDWLTKEDEIIISESLSPFGVICSRCMNTANSSSSCFYLGLGVSSLKDLNMFLTLYLLGFGLTTPIVLALSSVFTGEATESNCEIEGSLVTVIWVFFEMAEAWFWRDMMAGCTNFWENF